MKQTNEEKRIHLFGVKSKGSSYHFKVISTITEVFLSDAIYLISANKLDKAWAQHKVKCPTLYSYHCYLCLEHYFKYKINRYF